ncbi:3'-5' exonuclease [Candidatus Parvarchaeota archaeon]|nr:3'-5' exonuclease [Candidatus Parvarchaeota archaeon]
MIFLDIETSGLDFRKHGILSIGALEYENPSNQFYSEARLGPDMDADPRALRVNGFSENQIRDTKKQDLESLLKSFSGWLQSVEDRTPAGHNVHFDIGFIDHYAGIYGVQLGLGHRYVDTHSITYAYLLSEGRQIPMANKRTNIDSDYIISLTGLPRRSVHNALEDAKLCAEAFSRIVERKPLLEEYKKFPIPVDIP